MYSKETFQRGIEFLQGLTQEEYNFYDSFFGFLNTNAKSVIVRSAPWDGDPEEDIKPQDFKDFEKRQLDERFQTFKKKVGQYEEAYKKFL